MSEQLYDKFKPFFVDGITYNPLAWFDEGTVTCRPMFDVLPDAAMQTPWFYHQDGSEVNEHWWLKHGHVVTDEMINRFPDVYGCDGNCKAVEHV